MDPTVLPPIRPIHALLATGSIYRQKKSIVVVLVAVYLPILTGIVRESGRPHGSQRSLLFWATIGKPYLDGDTTRLFPSGSSASFMCGWHVHEKALVTVVAPMMLEVRCFPMTLVDSSVQIILKRDLHGSSRYVTAVASLSTFMMASLLPLLPDSPPELGLKCTLTVAASSASTVTSFLSVALVVDRLLHWLHERRRWKVPSLRSGYNGDGLCYASMGEQASVYPLLLFLVRFYRQCCLL